MAAQSKEFKLGDVVKCNSEHPQIAADKKDCGWSDAYHSFLKGTESTVIYAGDNVYDLKVGDTPHFCTVSCGSMLVPLINGICIPGAVNSDDITPYDIDPPKKTKSDGGSSSYYELTITNKAGESIKCETGDVIRTLVGNDFDFGNCVKALRRMYLATLGMGKEGTDLVYDANKIRWFLGEIERVNK